MLQSPSLPYEEFVDTQLKTKFAHFNIRVYPGPMGKETIVLRTENLNVQTPVLVRVHSECITGDTFGSLHCDCGPQLNKSLQLIAEEGGVLIYLRQEGRGIGLFEKMKTYKLQSQGHDTFDANVLLGHKPDLRSYEMVKTILAQLDIREIRLLTNNPSKVSDIAKLGIHVVERVPLLCKSNKHNKKYLETKKTKFQHFIRREAAEYVYQFAIDDSALLKEVMQFVDPKKTDPFLRIGLAISARHSTLKNNTEIKRIQDILETAGAYQELNPSIHFSFSESKDALQDALKVKELWPAAQRLQLNDWDHFDLEICNKLAEVFTLDIPLSDENFHLIENPRFREFVQKNGGFLLLDNSKGKGVKESFSAFKSKVDKLLAHGLNNITLCGGFGPDELDVYFELRRYYRINFSIDAESRLKINGKISKDKIKTYLDQLLTFGASDVVIV